MSLFVVPGSERAGKPEGGVGGGASRRGAALGEGQTPRGGSGAGCGVNRRRPGLRWFSGWSVQGGRAAGSRLGCTCELDFALWTGSPFPDNFSL